MKTVDPCFHFLQAGTHSPHIHNYITLALIAKLTYSYTSLLNMVQIKLPVAFRVVLVAAAIAPVVALPLTLKNGSVSYDMIDDYFLLIVYRSAELNARDDSEMLERSPIEHLE
jgi:hypothetical protein